MYLRLYADASKKLTMVARDDLTRAHTVTVNNACNETGYYTIPAEDIEPYARAGHDPDALEKVLATVEGTTVPVVDKLIATNTAPSLADLSTREGLEAPWDRYQLALFVALQMTRTWAFRRDLKELVDYWVQKRKELFTTDDRIAKHLARLGKPTRPQDIDSFRERLLGPAGPKLDFGDSRSIQAAVQFAIENTQPELFERRWHLRVFDEPVLLTSDAPVATRLAGPPGTPVPGVATAQAIYWPIGRRHLLSFERIRRGEPTADKVTLGADPARGRVANRLIASQAEKWIFHHPEDHPLDGVEPLERPPLTEETVRVMESPDEIRVTTCVLRRHS